MEMDVERKYRVEGARFIIDLGNALKLSLNTVSTGVVYYHRFFMIHSFTEYQRLATAVACIFLAGKVEETPKKCRDMLKAARAKMDAQKFELCFGADPKEELMTLERILLQTIKFDLQVEHPYPYLLKFAKKMRGNRPKIQEILQMAWTFVNDSLCTTLCLTWEPDIIAVALLYLSTRLVKFDITDWEGRAQMIVRQPGIKWFQAFVPDASVNVLEDVCHQFLDLYSPSDASKKPHATAPAIISSGKSGSGSGSNTPNDGGAPPPKRAKAAVPRSASTSHLESADKASTSSGVTSVYGKVGQTTTVTKPTSFVPSFSAGQTFEASAPPVITTVSMSVEGFDPASYSSYPGANPSSYSSGGHTSRFQSTSMNENNSSAAAPSLIPPGSYDVAYDEYAAYDSYDQGYDGSYGASYSNNGYGAAAAAPVPAGPPAALSLPSLIANAASSFVADPSFITGGSSTSRSYRGEPRSSGYSGTYPSESGYRGRGGPRGGYRGQNPNYHGRGRGYGGGPR